MVSWQRLEQTAQMAGLVGMGNGTQAPPILKRMLDRGFTEIDLRHMMERASSLDADLVEGRWIASCRHEKRPWKVIVEPDFEQQLVVVVTVPGG
jgi:hypothetical protein